MEMEIEEAKSVTVADSVVTTHVRLESGDIPSTVMAKDISQEQTDNDKGTQTEGHVIMGKQGEVTITTNFALVELVLNNSAIQQLTDSRTDVHQVTDTVAESLARLDWNGEQLLEKAMTAFRLTLTRDLMPQVIKDVSEILQTEHEQHKVQHLAQHLLQEHMTRLFGIDVSSLVFILRHDSMNAAMTVVTSETKQAQLQRLFFTFLPSWVAQHASVSVSFYTITPADRAQSFRFADPISFAFLATTWRPRRGLSAGQRAQGRGEDPTLCTSAENPARTAAREALASARSVSSQQEKAFGKLSSIEEAVAAASSEDEEMSPFTGASVGHLRRGWSEAVRREELESRNFRNSCSFQKKRKKLCNII